MYARTLPSTRSICICLAVVSCVQTAGAYGLLLHTFVLRLITSQGTCPGWHPWHGELCTASSLPPPSFPPRRGWIRHVTCPPFPSSMAHPSVLKKVFLTNDYTFLSSLSSFLLFFLVLLNLGGESLPDLPLSFLWHLWQSLTLILMEKPRRVMLDL